MSIITDFHNHVARSSAIQMVQAAHAKGLRILGLSEHIFQMEEARTPLAHMVLEGPMLSFASYIENVHSAAQELNFDVRLGLEVDFVPDKNEEIQVSLQGYPWDYLIGSVHQIDGKLFENVSPQTQTEGEASWLRYFELLHEAVNSGYFSVISHPVRMYTANQHIPPTLDAELEQLAAAATHKDVALEINGYDTLKYPHIVRRLARACAIYKTPISVGSDAHKPAQIAQAHEQTTNILHEAGVQYVRIWKALAAEEYDVR